MIRPLQILSHLWSQQVACEGEVGIVTTLNWLHWGMGKADIVTLSQEKQKERIRDRILAAFIDHELHGAFSSFTGIYMDIHKSMDRPDTFKHYIDSFDSSGLTDEIGKALPKLDRSNFFISKESEQDASGAKSEQDTLGAAATWREIDTFVTTVKNNFKLPLALLQLDTIRTLRKQVPAKILEEQVPVKILEKQPAFLAMEGALLDRVSAFENAADKVLQENPSGYVANVMRLFASSPSPEGPSMATP